MLPLGTSISIVSRGRRLEILIGLCQYLCVARAARIPRRFSPVFPSGRTPARCGKFLLLIIAKYSDNYLRSAGILPAVSGASRSRLARGQEKL